MAKMGETLMAFLCPIGTRRVSQGTKFSRSHSKKIAGESIIRKIDLPQEAKGLRVSRLYLLLTILLTMTLLGVIVGLVVAVKLGQMQRHMEQTQARLSQGVQQTLSSIKLPPGLENFFKTGSSMADASLMQPNISAIQPDVHQANDDNDGRYETRKECPSKCLKKDFVNPPLVILSMDGFSREYLDRFHMKSLSYITRCGATAERVFPPFPSRTFPSHYTIVTGLYPESHGIVDNNVYDPRISNKLESMKKTQLDGFYLGDPIWNIYKRHGGRTACLFWPGCGFNISGLRPDISPPYNKDLPFRNRFDMIVDWLLLPKDARPGLITAYLDQPDSAGHYQVDDRDIRNELVNLDDRLQYLIDRLETESLLPCVNLVLLSDHGMQKTNNTLYFSKLLNDSRVLAASGVIGRVHQFSSGLCYTSATLLSATSVTVLHSALNAAAGNSFAEV
ncbi:unnamed protein product [Heligmosomoides polygyrus]|uniref:Ectonucleotide pyrophosphatase/phosphodiesterase family member 3 n=1 Tax=Heligmosomoides polygyrus TaxID=6339 RepID=A0A183FQL1_HELPZ|nr:unnamed protein product [Heligmosomoides polygyrus]